MVNASRNNLFVTGEPTRTLKTEAAYRRRAACLVRQFEEEEGRSFGLRPFVSWLVRREAELADNTVRQYWASVLFALRHAPDVVGRSTVLTASEEALIEVVRNAPQPIDGDPGPLPKRTSALKLKRVSAKRLERLVIDLRSSTYLHDHDVLLLLMAGLVSGLRPIEWPSARLFWDGEHKLWVLLVENGKATNGRAHGDDRNLRWPERDPSLEIIRDWMERLHCVLAASTDRSAAWDAYYKKLRDALLRANRRLSPTATRRITFYTARHVFGAHAKAGLDRDEVAALMGHANDRTAGRHYAGAVRSKGVLPSLPQPSPRDVARIRHTMRPPPPVRHEHASDVAFTP